jgi:hypothetical protein
MPPEVLLRKEKKKYSSGCPSRDVVSRSRLPFGPLPPHQVRRHVVSGECLSAGTTSSPPTAARSTVSLNQDISMIAPTNSSYLALLAAKTMQTMHTI